MSKRKIEKISSSYEQKLMQLLQDKQQAAAYLQVALEDYQQDGELEIFLMAVRHVAEAQGGIGELAKRTHLNRESLYKTLSGKGNPKLQTIAVVLKGLNLQLTIKEK